MQSQCNKCASLWSCTRHAQSTGSGQSDTPWVRARWVGGEEGRGKGWAGHGHVASLAKLVLAGGLRSRQHKAEVSLRASHCAPLGRRRRHPRLFRLGAETPGRQAGAKSRTRRVATSGVCANMKTGCTMSGFGDTPSDLARRNPDFRLTGGDGRQEDDSVRGVRRQQGLVGTLAPVAGNLGGAGSRSCAFGGSTCGRGFGSPRRRGFQPVPLRRHVARHRRLSAHRRRCRLRPGVCALRRRVLPFAGTPAAGVPGPPLLRVGNAPGGGAFGRAAVRRLRGAPRVLLGSDGVRLACAALGCVKRQRCEKTLYKPPR